MPFDNETTTAAAVDFKKVFKDIMDFLKSFIEEIALALKGITKVWGWQTTKGSEEE